MTTGIEQSATTKELAPIEEHAIVTVIKHYPPAILKSVIGLVEFHAGILDDTRAELEEAKVELEDANKCRDAAQEIGILELTRRYRLMANRIEKNIAYLEKKISILEAGFLPIPRFDWARLEWSSERIDFKTLGRLKEAKEAGVFDAFGVANDSFTSTRRRRDPILVGILQGERGREEHFFIGVWK